MTQHKLKYKIEGTIPSTPYGNIRPSFEVDGNEEEVLEKMQELWNMFGEVPLPKRTEYGKLITTFTGEKVYYNDDTHKYYSEDGEELLSGSAYAKQFAKPFDAQVVSKAVSDKTGEPQEVLLKKWSLGGNIANSYGTAVHDAVEFMLMGGESEKIPSVIRDQVERLVNQVRSYDMTPITEVVVSDVATKKVGRIDCLLVNDKEFKILDYKTNRELKKDKLTVYTKQLEYYRDTLEAHGFKCTGLYVIHDDGETMEVKDLSESSTPLTKEE